MIVQVSLLSSRQLKFLNLRGFVSALQRDPDLAQLNPTILSHIVQTLFVVSGCDYVSFFSEIGKATFLRYFFAYASFITSGESLTPGTLADTKLGGAQLDLGFLAFLRLIGTVYFKKHASGFDTPSPATHFKRYTSSTTSIKQQHIHWINEIRDNIWSRTKFENQMIPSVEALKLHWQRSCWVINMWSQADKNHMVLPDIEQFGWKIVNNSLTIVWDTDENIQTIHNRVEALLKGCKCTTGCSTGRCSCKRKGSLCLEGCECVHCTNMHEQNQSEETDMFELGIEEDTFTMTTEDQTDELLDWVFGPTTTESTSSHDSEQSDTDD